MCHYLFFYGALGLFLQCSIIDVSIGLRNWSESVALLGFLLDFGTIPTVWHYCFFYFSIGLWNCSDSVAVFVFIWDFGTVPTVWHYWFWYETLEQFWQCDIIYFLYWTLKLFRQCGIICFDMGFWNCSDSVALFIFIRDIRTVPIVWHYLFF